MDHPDEGTGEAEGLVETPATQEAEPADETVNLQELASKEAESQQEDQPEAAAEEQIEPVEEFDEVDFEGSRYKVPKVLKNAFMAQAKFTQEMQKVADERREVEALRERATQQLQADAEVDQARVKIMRLKEDISQYEALTKAEWIQWSNNAPLDADAAYKFMDLSQKEISELTGKVNTWQNERSVQAETERSTRLQETRDFALTLPGWNDKSEERIVETAKSIGIPLKALQDNLNPALLNLLFHADIGIQAIKSKAAKPAAQPPPQLKPLTTISAKSSAPVRKSESEMNMTEYAQYWEAREKAKARR